MIEQGQPRQELRKDAIRLWSIVFFVVAAAPQLMAMLGTVLIVLRSGTV
jgi:hypothetical protein